MDGRIVNGSNVQWMEESSSEALRKEPTAREVSIWKIAGTSGGQSLCPFILVLFLQPFWKNLLLSAARWRLPSWRDIDFNPVWPILCSYGIGYVIGFHQPGEILLYLFVNIDDLLLKVVVQSIGNKNWLLLLPWDLRIYFKIISFWLCFPHEIWMSSVALCPQRISLDLNLL